MAAMPKIDAFAQRARSHVERLPDGLEETPHLGPVDGTRVFYLEIVEGSKSMGLAARVGDLIHWTTSAMQ